MAPVTARKRPAAQRMRDRSKRSVMDPSISSGVRSVGCPGRPRARSSRSPAPVLRLHWWRARRCGIARCYMPDCPRWGQPWRHCPSVGRSRLLLLLCESFEGRGADSNAVLRPRRREGLKEVVSTPAKTDRHVAVRRRRETVVTRLKVCRQ